METSLVGQDRQEKMRIARLWNFWMNVQDVIEKIADWPLHYQELVLQPHKNHRQRYDMFKFLFVNGVHPEVAVHLIQVRDYYSGQEVLENYDAEAHRDFQSFIRGVRDPGYIARMRCWNMHLQQNI